MLLVPIAVAGMMNVFVIGLLVFLVSRVRKIRGWPTVTGRIVRSRPTDSSNTADGFSGKLDRGLASTTTIPEIVYRYRVGNRQFSNKRFGIWSAAVDKRTAARMLATYPAGAEVTVHFDPDDPQRSVVDPDGRTAIVGLAICIAVISAILLFLIGVFLASS